MTKKKKDGFYKFLSDKFDHDNNIWSYIEECWQEYNRPPTNKDRIDKFLKTKNLEGHPADMKYKGWNIWYVYEPGTAGLKAWGFFAINLCKEELLPLSTQRHEFAIDILKEELVKLKE